MKNAHEHDAAKENEPITPAPPAHIRAHTQPAPPPAAPFAPAQKFGHQPAQKEQKKHAHKQACSHKPPTVDRNALSACGSSVTISDAAIAAR